MPKSPDSWSHHQGRALQLTITPQKEPKLVRARQIPEWDVYDREIAAFASRLSEEGGPLAASVDDLAAEKVADRPVIPIAEDVEGGAEDTLGDEDVDKAGTRIEDEL